MEQIEIIENALAKLKAEYAKFAIKGNGTAGTRARLYLQVIRSASQDLRKLIQAKKISGK